MLLFKFSCSSWHFKRRLVFQKILRLLIRPCLFRHFCNFFLPLCCIALFVWSCVVTCRICIVIPPPLWSFWIKGEHFASRNALPSYLFFVLSVGVFDTVSIVCKSLIMYFFVLFPVFPCFWWKIINFSLSYIGLCNGKSNGLRIQALLRLDCRYKTYEFQLSLYFCNNSNIT